MKTPALLLAALTAFALPVATAATAPSAKPRIEVCFVLDTTGSMGGLIEGAKQKIWSIANDIVSAKPTPTVKFALVAYRDRGDDYVTRLTPLSDDIDAIYGDLKKLAAQGGGDWPESVTEALDAAVHKVAWSTDRSVLKIIYLVGDAPPHTDYADGPVLAEVCADAAKRDLVINTVQCGAAADTRTVWTDIARRSEGQYVALTQTGNMIAIATPFDEPLAKLNVEVGKTIVAYGTASAQAAVRAKQAAVEAAPAALAADRLSYNAKAGGKVVQGAGELLDELKAGEISLREIRRDQLPAEMQKLSEADLRAKLEEKSAQRTELQAKIRELTEKREAFIGAEQKRLAASGQGDAFDTKVAEILREQAKRKGITY